MQIDFTLIDEVMKSMHRMHCIRKALPANHPSRREISERIQNFERVMAEIAELRATFH